MSAQALVIEPADASGRPYLQEECCWNRGSQFAPHLLGQICAAYGAESFATWGVGSKPVTEQAVMILSWIFGDELKPFVDRLRRSCQRVTLVANPATSAPYARDVFPQCLVVPSTQFTNGLRPIYLDLTRPSFIVQFSTGCPWRCPYCVWQNRYRLYDPFKVAEIILLRLDRLDPSTEFNLLGNELSGKRDWLTAFTSALPPEARFTSDLNVRNTTEQDVALAKRAGLTRAWLGIEFLTNRMLRCLNKGHSVADAFRVMKWLQVAGIPYRFSLRSGVGETVEDLSELSYNLAEMHARGLKPHSIICGNPMFAWPGTQWERSASDWINVGSVVFPRFVRRLSEKVKEGWQSVLEQVRSYNWIAS